MSNFLLFQGHVYAAASRVRNSPRATIWGIAPLREKAPGGPAFARAISATASPSRSDVVFLRMSVGTGRQNDSHRRSSNYEKIREEARTDKEHAFKVGGITPPIHLKSQREEKRSYDMRYVYKMIHPWTYVSSNTHVNVYPCHNGWIRKEFRLEYHEPN